MSQNDVTRTSPEAFRACAEKIGDADMQAVLQIAWVSAYRCPCTSYTSGPDFEDEFALSWDADLATA
jgi:hypothetical protein